jgi:hypothetical protein
VIDRVFSLSAIAAKAQLGVALLMILRWDPSMDAWEIVAYGTIVRVEEVTKTWPGHVHIPPDPGILVYQLPLVQRICKLSTSAGMDK